ncbi:unnamed protein product [Oppiella nova]|uniref:Nuclear receptor domain-containing protein n=1 Tax=Oppiella nova TaxID=334625 RepID=A0A7R9QG28_9ACAR|nr:unnamed protein product [Oppiella nova]CAG2164666.1 unnamed protein product [Oppiella nova]
MPKKREPKICGVCGGKAIAKNFGAMSCGPCKAFFRRNAIQNREWILNDEQKEVIKKRLQENRQLKLMSQKVDNSVANSCDSLTESSDTNDSNSSKNCDLKVSQYMERDVCFKSQEFIDNNDNYYDNSGTHSSNGCDITTNSSMIAIWRPITDYSNTFNERESIYLSELLSAMDMIRDPVPTNAQDLTSFEEIHRIMTLRLDMGVRDIIKVTKTLSAFQSVSETDRYILVKYSCVEICLLRSALVFDYQTEYWTNNEESFCMKLDVIKHSSLAVYNAYKKFQQKVYLYLLRRYMQLKYRSDGGIKYAKILNVLNDLHLLGHLQRQSGSQKDPKQLGPLLTEVYDTNSHTPVNHMN